MEQQSDLFLLLAALREEYPSLQIDIEHVQLEAGRAIFRVVITLPNGGRATGYGSAEGNDATLLRRAEMDALAQALRVLGYDHEHLAEAGVPAESMAQPAQPTREARAGAPRDEYAADPFNLGESPSPAEVAAATGVQLGVRRDQTPDRPRRPSPEERPRTETPGPTPDERRVPPERPAPRPGAATGPRAGRASAPSTTRSSRAPEQDDADADVVHGSFWQWAEQRGLHSQEEIEELLGRSIRGLTPAAVRAMIVEAQERRNA